MTTLSSRVICPRELSSSRWSKGPSVYTEEDMLALSGIQHYSFCPRQWALIHIEQQWAENALTVQGGLVHQRAHDGSIHEKRGEILAVRDLPVHSYRLGLRGACDVVEFVQDDQGVPLNGEDGLWLPTPIEYKRGKAKRIDADRLQLCAQVICLEEMLCCDISGGFLFYHATRSRERVAMSAELREETMRLVKEMHELFSRKRTPMARKRAGCRSCSIKDLCLPSTSQRETVREYFERRMRDIS